MWDLGDNGGSRAGAEGGFAVVHDGVVVVRNPESAGHRVVPRFEVVLPTWEYHRRRLERTHWPFGSTSCVLIGRSLTRLNLVPHDLDVVVAVGPGLLVPQA